jgi:hypothetical protein
VIRNANQSTWTDNHRRESGLPWTPRKDADCNRHQHEHPDKPSSL